MRSIAAILGVLFAGATVVGQTPVPPTPGDTCAIQPIPFQAWADGS